MRFIASFALLASILVSGLSAQGVPPLLTRSLIHDGALRIYRVYVPQSYQPGVAVPLVFGFHGGGGNAQSFASYRFDLTAERHNFLLVYPEGTGPLRPGQPILQSWNGGSCCGSAATTNVDDVGFVNAMIEAIQAEWAIDPARIYATGFSNGGIMSYRLGAELSERFAAIAPVGAAYMAPNPPRRPIPVFAIHGALDRNVPWEGGFGVGVAGVPFTSQEDSIEAFRLVNQADAVPGTLYRVVNNALFYEAAAPATDGTIRYLWLLDQAHTWPGQPSFLDPTQPYNQDIDINEEIWAFFAAHPKRAATDLLALGCSSQGSVPHLSSNLPILGGTLDFRIQSAPFASGALVVADLAATPLPIGSCFTPLDLASAAILSPLPPRSEHRLSFAIPADPGLHRLTLHSQAFFITASGPSASNALTLRFGW